MTTVFITRSLSKYWQTQSPASPCPTCWTDYPQDHHLWHRSSRSYFEWWLGINTKDMVIISMHTVSFRTDQKSRNEPAKYMPGHDNGPCASAAKVVRAWPKEPVGQRSQIKQMSRNGPKRVIGTDGKRKKLRMHASSIRPTDQVIELREPVRVRV